jgi:hypothetical protein
MGRGPRSPRRNDAQVGIRNIDPPDASPTPDEVRCWNFSIVSPIQIKVSEGSAISGLIMGDRVAISTRGKTLGFAPNQVAAEMIEAVRATGKRLRGQVLSDGDGLAAPKVELCLL